MSQYVSDPTKGYTADAAYAKYLRMKPDGSGKVTVAGADEMDSGTLQNQTFADGDDATLLLRNAGGTALFVAADAIAEGANFYAAAAGKVSATGTLCLGTAEEATTADGDVFEGLRREDASANDTTFTASADDSEGTVNTIPAGYTQVNVTAVVNDANDFVVLPAIAGYQIGASIFIACNAGANFELRTPAASNTKVNDVVCDGTQEYLCTDTDLIRVTKLTATAWVAQSITNLGAVRTAVVPD